jgi:ABC-2 type transport system ATP-binding protein
MTWGVSDVTFRYGPRPALSGVSLDVPSGAITAVVGADGAGKSTLLKVLAGAREPEAGEVRRPPPERLGFVSTGSGSYPDLTVAENLGFAARAYGVRDTGQRLAELLSATGLAGARDRLGGHLSGGMRQKLGVIRAMVHRPQLLVLDEPTTGVDPVSRADLWWLIARAAAEGAAVLLTTAYLDEAERASWLLALDGGRPLAEGTPEQIAEAVPGTIQAASERLEGDAARRAWRRGAVWRVWTPPEEAARTAPAGAPIKPDLHDAVTVAALARELAGARGDAA